VSDLTSPTEAPPPFPPDATAADIMRINHTRLRRDLLYGFQEQHVDKLVRQVLGSVRQEAIGPSDLSATPFADFATEASHLYDDEPQIRTASGSESLIEDVANTGYWPLMQRVQRDCWGMREMLIRVDARGGSAESPEAEPLSFRPVFPDMVDVQCHPRRPSIPVRVREYREHPIYTWVRHDLDIRDPDMPRYVVTDMDGADVTREVLSDTYSGEDYNYRNGDGNPILPYGVYHAAETGLMFDAFQHRGIVAGSLNVCLLLTFYLHIVENASWKQRWALNVEPVGMDVDAPENGRPPVRAIVTDPSTLLALRVIDPQQQPQIGQWMETTDPEAILRSIGMYERRMSLSAGFAPPDVQRKEADIRSGYSLAVDRESARERQRVFAPMYRRGDQGILRIAACLSNRFLGTNYTENSADYRINYTSLPKSPAERKIEMEELTARQAAGQIGPISAAISVDPDLKPDEALEQLVQVATERATVDLAVSAKLASMGVSTAPPAEAMSPEMLAQASAIVAQAQAGAVSPRSARALLGCVPGMPAMLADEMVAGIEVKPPPTSVVPAPADVAPPEVS